jgi:hypothetical protein
VLLGNLNAHQTGILHESDCYMTAFWSAGQTIAVCCCRGSAGRAQIASNHAPTTTFSPSHLHPQQALSLVCIHSTSSTMMLSHTNLAGSKLASRPRSSVRVNSSAPKRNEASNAGGEEENDLNPHHPPFRDTSPIFVRDAARQL